MRKTCGTCAISVCAASIACTAFALPACGSSSASTPDAGVGDAAAEASSLGDGAGSDVVVGADAASLPSVRITPNPAQSIRDVSPLLFGEGMEWTHYGQDVMLPDPTGSTSGTFRAELVGALQVRGIPVMRYPGGTLADLFHWEQAVGPMPSRVPQLDQSPGPDGGLPTLPPNFGPDEYAQLATMIGADMHLIVNVGTGSASEAANWLSYYAGKGIHVKYVEVGNEAYLGGPGNSYPPVGPSDYAARFDAYASALRAVDPNVQLMAIGCLTPNWSLTAMQAIQEKADFMAVHVAYAPFDVMNTSGVDTIDYYWAMMGGTKQTIAALSALETVVAAASQPVNKAAQLALTEHASLFYPGGMDIATLTRQVQRNQTIAAAIYSASTYQILLRDPKVRFANHINPLSPYWQASVTVAPQGPGYPATYDTRPTTSAFGYAYGLYRQAAGGTVIATDVSGSPTFDTPAEGVVPVESGIAALDSVSVKVPDGSIYVYVVNRDLVNDVAAQVVLPGAASAVKFELLDGPAYDSRNDPDHPMIVAIQDLPPPVAMQVDGTRVVVANFPAHSIARLILK
jgi:alpha-N-arabinofuranosidase